MKLSFALSLFISIVYSSSCFAQKQLVFIKHNSVVARFTEGGHISVVLKNKQHKDGFIVELNEFSMITSNDTIKYQSILKVASNDYHVKANSGIGGLLFVAGLGYIIVDQVNVALGYNKGGWDKSDQTALIVAGVGAAILFIKPKFRRLRPGTAIRAVDYTSPFYLMPQ